MEKAYFVAETDLELTVVAVDYAGQPIICNGAQSIEFALQNHETGETVLTKTMAGGAITAVDADLDNKFMVAIDHTDTVGFEGRYVYEAKIIDAEGRLSRLRADEKANAPQIIFRPKIAS